MKNLCICIRLCTCKIIRAILTQSPRIFTIRIRTSCKVRRKKQLSTRTHKLFAIDSIDCICDCRFRLIAAFIYSKKFLEAHREEIALHKAAKAAFDEAGLQKLPKVKALDAEFAELLTKKKAAYPEYRKARNEMQELVRAQKNVERFFAEEKPAQENEQAR